MKRGERRAPRSGYARRCLIGAVAALVLVTLCTPTSAMATSGVSTLHEISSPAAIAVAQSRIWVANFGDNTITELNATNGSLIRVIRKLSYKIDGPSALVINGHDLWVTNSHGNSVTELNTENGALIRVVRDPSDKINDPNDIAIIDGHVWILDTGNSDITELRANDGVLVRVINGAQSGGLSSPLTFAFTGDDMWVSSDVRDLQEFNTTTGAYVNNRLSEVGGGSIFVAADGSHIWVVTSTGALTEFSAPNLVQLNSFYSESESAGPISISGGDLWVASTNEVTEYNATTGRLDLQVKIPPYAKFVGPTCIEASGSHVWLCYKNSLRELNSSDGSLVRVIPKR
jgi:DNA-binding beta-propeller fold protein YncE